MIRVLYVIGVMLITWQVSNCQSYNFINYSIDEGLAHNKVTCFAEDHFGNLWIGTQGGGLSKFNGMNFENLTIKDGLASNYVRDIISDSLGNIWAATAAGISKIAGDTIINFLNIDNDDLVNSVNCLQEGRNNVIYFSDPTGNLGVIQHDVVRYIPLEDTRNNERIIAMAQDSRGSLYLLSSISGLFRYSNGQLTNMLNNTEYKGYLLGLTIDENDVMWIATHKGLLFKNLGREDAKFHPFKPLNGFFVKSVSMKDSSEFWIVSALGLMKYSEGKVRKFGLEEGLTNAGVNAIYCDREGTVWAASDGEGIFKLYNEQFVFYGNNSGLGDFPVTAVTGNETGGIWVGEFGNGLKEIENGRIITFITQPTAKYITTAVTDLEGNAWFGTRGEGIIKKDGSELVNYTQDDGLAFNSVRNLFVDKQNNLWIGTINGLSRFDGKEFKSYTTNDGLHDNSIWGFSEQPEGLVIITRRGFNLFNNEGIRDLALDSSLFKRRLNTALKVGNAYWIGYSGHGIIRCENNNYTTYTTEEGLSSDLIYNLIADNEGNILVGTERGIDKLILNDQFQVIDINNYDAKGARFSHHTLPGAHYKDAQGNVWFGNDQGLLKYEPGLDKINNVEPTVYIADVRLFYEEVDWTAVWHNVDQWTGIPMDLALPYDHNNLIIDYFGTSLSDPAKVTYVFRLIGLDDKWSPPTTGTEAAYTNLPPGAYTFEVKAANADGVWTREAAHYTFKIIPPFWQRPWFYVLILLLFVLGFKLYQDYRVRTNLNKILSVEKIRAEELLKVRKRMARDFHDNMGNQLASITVFTNLINLQLKNRSKDIDDLLDNIEKHVKSLFNGTKDFIWSMDPDSDNLQEIFVYIKDFGEDLYENTHIDFYAASHGLNDRSVTVPSGWSRQLVLIFKEAMTNALKHAKATEVHLELKLKINTYVINLIDNGHGIPSSVIHKGNGFKNMRARAAQIGATIQIESVPHKSTEIRVEGVLQSEPERKKTYLLKNIF